MQKVVDIVLKLYKGRQSIAITIVESIFQASYFVFY